MSTFVDGIAASEHLDSSGEIISIEGMDISTLDKSGTLTWEHNNSVPSSVVGKILKAKKIFSEKDCEDERMLFFWKKCEVPYIYIMGELFDDYNDSAKEVAGMLRYDHDRDGKQEVPVIGFSIEGAYLQREGGLVKRSIARKCTLTTQSCNKMAMAKLLPQKGQKSIDDLFKTEFSSTVGLIKAATPNMAPKTPAAPKASSVPASTPKASTGSHMGNVGSHSVGSHATPMHYPSATHHELKGIADVHYKASQAAYGAGNTKLGEHHRNQTQRFLQASNRLEQRQKVTANAKPSAVPNSGQKPKTLFNPELSGKINPPSPVKKTLDAGSGMAAPSRLVGGAALVKENICVPKEEMIEEHKELVNTLTHPTKGRLKAEAKKQTKELKEYKKSEKLKKAEEVYSNWDKRSHFEEMMNHKYPDMTPTEIKVLGQTLAVKELKEQEEKEEALRKLI